MRTLNLSLIGTSGPGTALLRAGVDSIKTACALAGLTARDTASAVNRTSAQAYRRPGRIISLFAESLEKPRKSWPSTTGRKLYRTAGRLLSHSETAWCASFRISLRAQLGSEFGDIILSG